MKLNAKTLKSLISIGCMALGTGLFLSCGSDDSGSSSDSSSIVLTGQLSLADSGAALNLVQATADDLSIYCVSFDIPPVAGTGDIDAEGNFSLTLATANTSVGCFFLYAEEVVGTMVFEDSAATDLSGGSSTQDRLAFGGGTTNLGAISLDLTTGQAVVDVATITGSIVDTEANAAQAVDLTGSYLISSSGLDLPSGYAGVCTGSEPPDTCFGPTEGEPIFVKLISGVKAGTTTPAHAMMIWESEELFNTCGAKLGFTYAQGITHGFDFTNSGVAEGEFTWKAGLTDGWKDTTNARANHTQMKMERVADFNGYSGMKQYFSQYTLDGGGTQATAGFQFSADTNDSGCKNAAGEPVRVNDWSGMTCNGEALTGGLHKSTCTGTSDGVAVTCIHVGGIFDLSGTAITDGWPQWPNDFDILLQGPSCSNPANEQWGPDGLSCANGDTLTQGALCSSVNTSTEAGALAQLRCYLEYSHMAYEGGGDQATTECIRRVNGNWSAATAAEFIVGDDGPKKAIGEHVFDLFKFDSASSGTLRGQDRYFRGVQVGDNWTDCEILESFSIALKKYTDSDDLLAEMIMTEKNLSHKPACIAEYGEDGGSQKMMFKLVKQP